jgi:hypothetical protein
MRRALRDNGLGLFFGGIFLLTLVGQGLVGHADFNHQQLSLRPHRHPGRDDDPRVACPSRGGARSAEPRERAAAAGA